MKKLLYTILLVGFFSCEKAAPEQKIVFTMDAVNNSTATGTNFPVAITLTSAMPSQGIKTVNQSSGMALPQGAPFSTTSAKNTIVISGLPQQQWCNVTIKVTSNNTSTNTDSQSFTVVYK
jgi:protein-disulfide isomerase